MSDINDYADILRALCERERYLADVRRDLVEVEVLVSEDEIND